MMITCNTADKLISNINNIQSEFVTLLIKYKAQNQYEHIYGLYEILKKIDKCTNKDINNIANYLNKNFKNIPAIQLLAKIMHGSTDEHWTLNELRIELNATFTHLINNWNIILAAIIHECPKGKITMEKIAYIIGEVLNDRIPATTINTLNTITKLQLKINDKDIHSIISNLPTNTNNISSLASEIIKKKMTITDSFVSAINSILVQNDDLKSVHDMLPNQYKQLFLAIAASLYVDDPSKMSDISILASVTYSKGQESILPSLIYTNKSQELDIIKSLIQEGENQTSRTVQEVYKEYEPILYIYSNMKSKYNETIITPEQRQKLNENLNVLILEYDKLESSKNEPNKVLVAIGLTGGASLAYEAATNNNHEDIHHLVYESEEASLQANSIPIQSL